MCDLGKMLGILVFCACCLGGTQSARANGCTSNTDCDDGLFCNGQELCSFLTNDCFVAAGSTPECGDGVCDEAGNSCVECNVNADCDDGLFCNGAETCNAGECGGFLSFPPCGGVLVPFGSCLVGTCDEELDMCVDELDPSRCVLTITRKCGFLNWRR